MIGIAMREGKNIFDEPTLTFWKRVVDFFALRTTHFYIDSDLSDEEILKPYFSCKVPEFGYLKYYGEITPDFLDFLKKQFNTEKWELNLSDIGFMTISREEFSVFADSVNSGSLSARELFDLDSTFSCNLVRKMDIQHQGWQNFFTLDNLDEYDSFAAILADYHGADIVNRWFRAYDGKAVELNVDPSPTDEESSDRDYELPALKRTEAFVQRIQELEKIDAELSKNGPPPKQTPSMDYDLAQMFSKSFGGIVVDMAKQLASDVQKKLKSDTDNK